MRLRRRPLRPLPARADADLPGRPGLHATPRSRRCWRCVSCERPKPKLAVWKFASCDGCQLTLLDLEDELLALAGAVEHRRLPRGDERASSTGRTTSRSSRARSRRAHDAERIQEVRARVEGARHDRRLRDRRRDPGAAQLRRRRRVHPRRLRLAASTSRRSPPRRRSPRTCRSTSSCTAARSTSASCSRS